ncbi:MAG: LysR family transcriptional regulator [Myxococcota bacterium]
MPDLFDGVVPFVHTAKALSFRAAARELGVTPAAVSKAVKRLEAQLGVELLHRTTRTVTLSDEGTRFLARCQDAMALVQAGRDQASAAARAPRGELRVSLSHVLGHFLVRLLPRFVARHPDLRVELRITDRVAALVDDRIDVALRVGPLRDSTLVARRLLTTRWATVASPAYLARSAAPTTPEELRRHDCLCFRSPRGKLVPWSFSDPTTRAITTHEITGRVDVDQGPLVVETAIAGMGIAQVFDFMVAADCQRGRLVEVLPEYATSGPDVFAVTLPGRRRSPKVRAFLDFVHEELRPLGPAEITRIRPKPSTA